MACVCVCVLWSVRSVGFLEGTLRVMQDQMKVKGSWRGKLELWKASA